MNLEVLSKQIELIEKASLQCKSDSMACIWLKHRQALIEKYPDLYRQYIVSRYTPEFHYHTSY